MTFFSRVEQTLLAALQRSGFNNAGLRRADLLSLLAERSPVTLTRQPPAPARRHQRVTGTYRYYLACAGRATAAGRRLTEHIIIRALT